MCPSATQPAAMINPYQSYIQMLLPLVISTDDSFCNGSGKLPPQVTVSICADNARSLADDASMTMKLLKPKVSDGNRWSSVPDLQGFMSAMPTKSRKSNLRSIEDLQSLMTNNSRRPRSTDNLRACFSLGSLNKKSTQNTPPSRGNDRWESKSSQRLQASKRNPFDLQMPGLPPLSISKSPKASLRILRSTIKGSGTSAKNSLKLPQRISTEPVYRRDDREPGLPMRRKEESLDDSSNDSRLRSRSLGRAF